MIQSNFAWGNRHLAISTIVRLPLSTIRFYSGVSGTVKFCLLLFSMQYHLKCSLENSSTLSDFRIFGIPCLAIKSWNLSRASHLARKNFTTLNLLYSSAITSTYLNPWTLGGFRRPYMSINTFSKIFVLLTSIFSRTDCFVWTYSYSLMPKLRFINFN